MKISKILAVILALAMILSATGVAFANEIYTKSDNDGNEVSTASYEQVCFGDSYGRTDWPSLGEAINYYGSGYTYTYCGGNPYNYFYTFSDGSRMFFGVNLG